MFFLLEICFTLTAMGLAFASPRLGDAFFARGEKLVRRLSRRRTLSVVVVGFSALAVRAALLPVQPIPVPGVQDEFSQLLEADTFAHGRITNPPHRMWVHFETLSVIQQPTYASKYPPAPPLLMAAGEKFAGNPFWGVLAGIALMCGAVCWMLQAWVPEGWALLGGFLAIIRLGSFTYWANSYWGGALAGFAGALIMGALPRIKKEQQIRHAIVMALGLGILANTRPYEGLCFAVPILLSLGWWFFRQGGSAWTRNAGTVALPLSAVLLGIGLCTAYYFQRVTGSAWRMPYTVYQQAYDPLPNFVWQSARSLPPYRHKVMLAWELTRTHDWGGRTVLGFFETCLQKFLELSLFFLGPTFGITLFAALAIAPHNLRWRDISREVRFFVIILGVSLAAVMVEHSGIPHYLAQTTCVVVGIVLMAMQYLCEWNWRGARAGKALVRFLIIACAALFLLRSFARPLNISTAFPAATWFGVSGQDEQNSERARISSELQETPGKHLVFVRYTEGHFRTIASIGREWVYNAADIDGSKIVWAQDMGPQKNQELIDYYKDRQVWLVQPDYNPPRLAHYSASADESAAK